MKPKGYQSRLVMHIKLAKGGHVFNRELTDYPGVSVVEVKEEAGQQYRRDISFGGEFYPTIEAAVAAWESAKSANQAGK